MTQRETLKSAYDNTSLVAFYEITIQLIGSKLAHRLHLFKTIYQVLRSRNRPYYMSRMIINNK